MSNFPETSPALLSFTVRMTFNPVDREEIVRTLRELTLASRNEPGCVTYIPHFVEDEPCTVVIYEQYLNQSAAEHHRSTPHYLQHAAGTLYAKKLQMKLEPLLAIL